MNPSHPQPLNPALARVRVPIPAGTQANETVNLTAEEMQAELERLRGSAKPNETGARSASDLKLYVGLGLAAALLAVVAFLIANPELPAPPPAPKPLSGYAP